MLAQLETEAMLGSLTLQKLWYYILPTMHTMQVLVAIVTTIGKVLNFKLNCCLSFNIEYNAKYTKCIEVSKLIYLYTMTVIKKWW